MRSIYLPRLNYEGVILSVLLHFIFGIIKVLFSGETTTFMFDLRYSVLKGY